MYNMKRTDGVRAKGSRHSSHLLNRLLGWRRRGSSSSHQESQPLQRPSSVAQYKATSPQQLSQHAPAADTSSAHHSNPAGSPATNILFSIVQQNIQDNTSNNDAIDPCCEEPTSSICLDPNLMPEQRLELYQSSANGEIPTPVQCLSTSEAYVVTMTSEAADSHCPVIQSPSAAFTDAPKFLSVKRFPSGTYNHTIVDLSGRDEAIPANTVKFIQDSFIVQKCNDQINNGNSESIGHTLLDNRNLIQVLATQNFSEEPALSKREMSSSFPSGTSSSAQNSLAANFDQRYGGQYLTPEQLPEFCQQLHQLVEMIRNIQAYSTVTGEYPSALERRLASEARDVAALAAEVRNARDAVARARAQRRAVRSLRRDASRHMAALREEEMRELETTVRVADRNLFKSWECLRETVDVHAFDALLSEVKGKQNALSCLSRLIENRCAALELLSSSANQAPRSQLPLLLPSSGVGAELNSRTRYFPSKRLLKRKKRERDNPTHSVPVSNEPSDHSTDQSSSRNRLPSICTITNPRGVNMNPMTVPYELISQSGIPANMLPSMGSNSNHNLTLIGPTLPSFVPFRFSARQFVPATEIRVTSSDRDTVGDMLFTRNDDRSADV